MSVEVFFFHLLTCHCVFPALSIHLFSRDSLNKCFFYILVKVCVSIMFHDTEQHILIKNICCGKSCSKYVLTYTENVMVTVLDHFLRTRAILTTMGHRWIGTWARTCLCSTSASGTAFVPVSPCCPATIPLAKKWSKYSVSGKGHFSNIFYLYIGTFPKLFVTKENVEVITWTQNIIVAVLTLFLQTWTYFSSMGWGWIGAWAKMFLCSTTTSHATFAPTTPGRPATIY